MFKISLKKMYQVAYRWTHFADFESTTARHWFFHCLTYSDDKCKLIQSCSSGTLPMIPITWDPLNVAKWIWQLNFNRNLSLSQCTDYMWHCASGRVAAGSVHHTVINFSLPVLLGKAAKWLVEYLFLHPGEDCFALQFTHFHRWLGSVLMGNGSTETPFGENPCFLFVI